MPNLEAHCAINKQSTGFVFEELHRWIDSPAQDLGFDHRTMPKKFEFLQLKDLLFIMKLQESATSVSGRSV